MALGTPKALALSVGPSVVELRAPAGGHASGHFTVSNDTTGPILVIVEAEPLAPKGYVPIEPAVWLQTRPSSVILQAGESADVTYDVHVPHDATGELASEVVFVQHISTDHGGVQVRMGMAVYAAIAGTEALTLEIEHMALQVSKEEAHVHMRIANRGNIHCRPEGMVKLMTPDGQLVAQGRLTRGMPVHPAGAGTFLVPITIPKPGAYRLAAEVTCHAAVDVPVHLTAIQQGELDAAGSWTTTAARPAPRPAVPHP